MCGGGGRSNGKNATTVDGVPAGKPADGSVQGGVSAASGEHAALAAAIILRPQLRGARS